MNAKKCKMARKFARAASQGMQARGLMATKTNPRTAVNAQNTTRGIYRQLKRLMKRGETLESIIQTRTSPAAGA